MRSVDLAAKIPPIDDHWSPQIVGELNDSYLKRVQGQGEFLWDDDYAAYLRRTGVTECRATPGNYGVEVLRRTVGDETHFLFISFWDSMDAIRTFAGDDVERAHYYPEDRDYLLELEPTVTHYEVLEQ